MNREKVEKVSEILEGALSVKVTLRPGYLDEACAGDTELRREIESLLLSHEQAGSTFLNPPQPMGAVPRHPAVAAGRRIGAYDILQEIARGGMGEVFAAARADGQYKKKVAIKLVRGGYDTEFILARFRTERQILATLDHPNIARLLDGGTTEDGIPYLVMELIEGVPVDEYCAKNKLNASQVISMFRQICAAVHYAHQRLVIHRDIKPSNILVTTDGVPKLLDFGIAKIFDPASGEEATLVRPMTPEYASPEQLRGKTITTASDIYSLGVVLYQLLTGISPYHADSRSPAELARAITEIEPDKPSSAVLRVTPANASGGAATDETPGRRSRRLRGDLDAIVLKALRKEPEHRYLSAEQFSEDLARHLAGLPVTARKGSWSYRAAKALRRHKLGVTAAALVGLAILGGVLATVREARIARRQAALAEAERARAEKRFNDVREFSDSLLFEIHDAIQNLPGATPARQLLLDRAVRYLDSVAKDSTGDPNLQRELAWGYQRMAVVQGNPTESNLGDAAAAEASDRKAAALFEAVARANPNDVIDQLNVAMIHRILSFSALLRPSGRQDLEMAMAITDRLMKSDGANPKVRSERSIEYQNLGLMEDALGNRTRALENFRKNLSIKQDLFKTTPAYRRVQEGIAVATVLVAGELVVLGMRNEARQQLHAAIDVFESVLAQGSDIAVERELAVARVKLGDLELMDGNTAAARAAFAQARAKLLPMAAADPKNQMLQLDGAGLAYEDARLDVASGRYAAAIAALQTTIHTFEQLHTTDRDSDDIGPGLAPFFIWLGEAQAGARQLDPALQSYQRALDAIAPVADAPDSDDRLCQRATAYVKIADIQQRQGKFVEALGSYQQALKIVAPLVAPERGDIPAVYVLADAYAGMGRMYVTQSRSASNASEAASLLANACNWLGKSWNAWQKIPNASSISPGGFAIVPPAKSMRTKSGIGPGAMSGCSDITRP